MEVTPKMRKRMPPIMATVRSEIFAASILPPITARPVQKAWPTRPPSTTPKGFLDAASATVAICERSPHSARKVSVNACRRRRELRAK